MNERDAAFHRNAYDLVALAFNGSNPDMLRAAALMAVNAPGDSEMGRRLADLSERAVTGLRNFIFRAKPNFAQFEELVKPYVEATLFEDGFNVFRPSSVLAEIETKVMDRDLFGKDPIDTTHVQKAITITLQALFSQNVIEVVDKQLWIMEPAEIEPGLLRALSSRSDVPMPCLVPTSKALIETVTRYVANRVAARYGLRVPVDLGGIEMVPDDRALRLAMPKKGAAS